MHRVALVALLAACKPNPEPGVPWIAPLDGQTDVHPSAPLLLHVANLQLPPDYPVPHDLVRVVDLDDPIDERDAFLPGALTVGEDVITFVPDEGWVPGHRYAWSVGELAALDRAPELRLPDEAYGEAVFATSGATDVLDATIAEDGRVCALLSRHLAVIEDAPEATLDDAPVALGAVDLQPEDTFLDARGPTDADDPGVTVACFTGLDAAPGSSLRLWWGAAGPWRVTLEERPVADLILDRRRPR